MKLVLAKSIGFIINLLVYVSPKRAAFLAIRLFSKPRKGKHTEEATDFLNTAFQEEVFLKDRSIMTYRWPGKGETILLVHGWESNAFRWKSLIDSLKLKNFNIVAIDAPAHGKSTDKSFHIIDYAEYIHLVSRKFKTQTIISHSFGGLATICFQYKYRLPELKKIVLLGAPSNLKDVMKRYTKLMSYNSKVIKAINAFYLNQYGHLPEYYNVAKFTQDLNSSGLIIHDLTDPIVPYQDALDYKRHFTNAKVISTKNLDHSLKSREVEEHILEFVTNQIIIFS
ncbi:alpha/beta fold hydrolase [Aestuariivivens sediminicola]|uniref:alpha/beta fold hydrolase n=1 Tax=Aestuariivivens sediminicola TaxID=2913560 RepID=UPI001F57513D|nr:alpha/beta hydrolase [Aestuariivivens sediminicola]